MLLTIFLMMRQFTTLTLDGQTFLQVFNDSRRVKRPVDGQMNVISEEQHGFCLIKLQWMAFNALVVHMGFYQVSERSKNQFMRALRKSL